MPNLCIITKERARTLLAQHRLGNGDIVRHLKLLISNLAQAQGSDLPEMQKFGILREKRAATSSNTNIPLRLPAEVVILSMRLREIAY